MKSAPELFVIHIVSVYLSMDTGDIKSKYVF